MNKDFNRHQNIHLGQQQQQQQLQQQQERLWHLDVEWHDEASVNNLKFTEDVKKASLPHLFRVSQADFEIDL